MEAIRGRTIHSDEKVIPFEGTIFDKVIAKYRRFRCDVKGFTPGIFAATFSCVNLLTRGKGIVIPDWESITKLNTSILMQL